MKTKTFFFRLVFIVIPIVIFNSCNKDDKDLISLNISEKILNFGDEYQIEATSNSVITYTVESEYSAKVSETGLVTARFIGETNISLENAEDKKIFKIIVEPKYNLYPEPDVEFGDTKSSIIAQFGSDYIEVESAIGYTDYSIAAPMIMFSFDNDNTLSGYSVLVSSVYFSTLVNFLTERYLIISADDDLSVFINGLSTTTATTSIGVTLYDISYWMVLYIPMSTKSSTIKSASVHNNFDKLFKLLNN